MKRPSMNTPVSLVAGLASILLSLAISSAAGADSQREVDRRTRQEELDYACEMARQEALAPIRRKIYAECMNKRNDHTYCFNDASAYDGVRQHSKPRFYDLPECVKAFEYHKSHRERY